MKKTIQILNKLCNECIIKEYAIAGGMAQFYYIEPSVTYDLDLIVNIDISENDLSPLKDLYKWADENDYKTEGEHILLGGIPVQFLLPYNQLIKEALKNKVQIELFNEKTFILSAEYLMAILLQTWRATDKERLIKFLTEYEYNNEILIDILKRYELLDKFNDYKDKQNG